MLERTLYCATACANGMARWRGERCAVIRCGDRYRVMPLRCVPAGEPTLYVTLPCEQPRDAAAERK